jgi:hypothetical protein
MKTTHSQLKQIRTQLGKYSAHDLINYSIFFLRQVDFGDSKVLAKLPPWYLFRMIKDSFLFGAPGKNNKRELTEKEFLRLFSLFHELGELVKMPNEYDNLFILFRNMAFQQFWFQERIAFEFIARQEILFHDLTQSTSVINAIHSEFGFSAPELTILFFAILTRFQDPQIPNITFAWFKSLPHVFPIDKMNTFFSTISKDFWGFRDFFSKRRSSFRNPDLE